MTSDDGAPDAISLAEAAHLLGLSQLRVARLQREGLLTRLACQPSYSRADVLAFAGNPWITDIEAAFVLGVSLRRARQLAEAGEISSHRMSNGDLALRLGRAPRPRPRLRPDATAAAAEGADDPYELLARSLQDHGPSGADDRRPTASFPDLTSLRDRAYDASDHSGHVADPAHAVADQRRTALDQHRAAFHELVDLARQQDGWVLTRFVLLSAHEVCRAGLEAAWVARTGSAPPDDHDLERLWTRLEDVGGLRHLDLRAVARGRELVRTVLELAPDGRSTRHPSLGPRPRTGVVCCLDLGTLRDAVAAFLMHLEQR